MRDFHYVVRYLCNIRQVAQLSQRDHAAGCVSFGQNVSGTVEDYILHQTLSVPENQKH